MNKNTSPKRPIFFRLLRFLILFIIVMTLLGVGGGIGLYLYFADDLPNLDRIENYRPPLAAEVFDADGSKIGEFWSEYRFLTPMKDIPDRVVKALIATEDERFYSHHGLDPLGILRAFVANLKAGHTAQGGSTLTQQVAKALVLSPERSFSRKVKEAIIATQMENKLSKDQILYLYLNHTFFGNRAYGITAAARNYFHKPLKDLNIAEMAMLVGLPKAPSKFDPIINPQRAKERQQYVINRMEELGFITKPEAADARKVVLKIYKADPEDRYFNNRYTPYFTEEVRRSLKDKYGDEALYKSGWKIYTTVSLEMYKAAEQAVMKGIREVDHRHGFRGPSQHLTGEEAILQFNDQNHLSILEDTGEADYGSNHTPEDFLKLSTPLKESQNYNAVILGGSRSKGFEVQVGNAKGTIASETMNWAGGAADALKTGDVVQVLLYKKAVAATAKAKEASKNKKTAESTTAEAPKESSTTALEEKVFFALDQTPALQSALYSYEPFTGEVKAIIGGTDFRKNEFNRATQALRQPGSSIKPLIYAAAIDKGYNPNTTILDAPIAYDDGSGKPWTPKNYGGGFSGPMSFRTALVHSVNLVTVRILMDVGTHYADAFMRKLGLTSDIKKYYSMALGANDIYLYELARAYGAFATGGVLPDLYMVRKIEDPFGKIIEEHKPMNKKFMITWDVGKTHSESAPAVIPEATSSQGEEATGLAKIPESQAESQSSHTESQPESQPESKPVKSKEKAKKIPWDEMAYNADLIGLGEQAIEKDQLSLSEYEKKLLYGDYIPKDHVMSPRTAATMVSILQDVVKYGTGGPVLPLQKPAAGKTGTTNGSTDAWFMGFTPTLVTGVWVGHDTKQQSIGHGETGGHVSAPIWLYYMIEASKRYPTKDFKLPPWIDLSQYQTPMEIVHGDMESENYGGGASNTGGGSQGGGADFFIKDF